MFCGVLIALLSHWIIIIGSCFSILDCELLEDRILIPSCRQGLGIMFNTRNVSQIFNEQMLLREEEV